MGNTRPYQCTLDRARFALLDMSPDIFGVQCKSVVLMYTRTMFFYGLYTLKKTKQFRFGGHMLCSGAVFFSWILMDKMPLVARVVYLVLVCNWFRLKTGQVYLTYLILATALFYTWYIQSPESRPSPCFPLVSVLVSPWSSRVAPAAGESCGVRPHMPHRVLPCHLMYPHTPP